MKLLAIDTSAVAASAAVLSDGKLLGECYLNIGLTHSATMLSLIDSVLALTDLSIQDIDCFAVSAGPGSFTGIRIGVSAVKGLAFTDNKKCFPVSTLEGLAYGVDLENCLICPVMDARCQQVYTALFEKTNGKIQRLAPDQPLKLAELDTLLSSYRKDIILVGDGSRIAYEYLHDKFPSLQIFSEPFRFQHASGVAFAAFSHYNNGESPISGSELQPEYLRLSQAEREYKKRSDNNGSNQQ